jgi:hypothetical protein
MAAITIPLRRIIPMRRTGNRGAAFMPHQVRVRCNGKLHTIALNKKGQLVRLDHDHDPVALKRERNYHEIGGSWCRCTEVVTLFSKAVSLGGRFLSALPPPLRDAARQAAVLRAQSEEERWFREAQRRWRGSPEGEEHLLAHVLHHRLGLPTTVKADVWRKPGRDVAEIRLTCGDSHLYDGYIDTSWASTIYLHGLAYVQGWLTLLIVEPARSRLLRGLTVNKLTALQCRPPAGPFRAEPFETRYAHLTRRPDGSGFDVTTSGGSMAQHLKRGQLQPHGSAIREQVTIQCGGEEHRVALDDKEDIVLLDHDQQEIRRLLNCRKLRGGLCECVQTLLFWRDFCSRRHRRCQRTDFRAAVESLEDCRRGAVLAEQRTDLAQHCDLGHIPREVIIQKQRLEEQLRQPSWTSDPSFLYENFNFVERFITRLAHDACGAPERIEFFVWARSWGSKTPHVYVWSKPRPPFFSGEIDRDWMRQHYFRGLGVVDRHLVLSSLTETAPGWPQSHGGWLSDGSKRFTVWTMPVAFHSDPERGFQGRYVVRSRDSYHLRQ